MSYDSKTGKPTNGGHVTNKAIALETLGRKIREKIVRPSVMAVDRLLSSQLKIFQFIMAVRGALVS